MRHEKIERRPFDRKKLIAYIKDLELERTTNLNTINKLHNDLGLTNAVLSARINDSKRFEGLFKDVCKIALDHDLMLPDRVEKIRAIYRDVYWEEVEPE